MGFDFVVIEMRERLNKVVDAMRHLKLSYDKSDVEDSGLTDFQGPLNAGSIIDGMSMEDTFNDVVVKQLGPNKELLWWPEIQWIRKIPQELLLELKKICRIHDCEWFFSKLVSDGETMWTNTFTLLKTKMKNEGIDLEEV